MAITNVTTYFTAGSATGTSMQATVAYSVQESLARRVIAKNLKIVTGCITWAASGFGGSAGDVFQYKMFGDRFLWMGFTPRLGKTAASHAEAGYIPIYDPTVGGGTIYMVGSNCEGSTVGTEGGEGQGLCLVGLGKPFAQYTCGFCLLVCENTAGSGVGV